MREKMERLVLLPFTFGCVSESSVAVNVQQPRRSTSKPAESNIPPLRTKEGEEEEDDDQESLSSGDSMKNSFRSLSVPAKPNISTGIHRLFKGFKNFSQLFVEKDELEMEMEMEIGGPTDVKHVTHIGWDGSTTTNDVVPIKGWENLISPDLLSGVPSLPNEWTQFELAMAPQQDHGGLAHSSLFNASAS
ncbi:hypothetical protein UlMin_029904 [Ulmus minor]